MSEAILTCEKHPDRESYLRCIRCNRVMCTECAKMTPVGYICRECSRAQEDKFYSQETLDYPKVFAICAMASLAGNVLALTFSFFILSFFIGGVAGGTGATFARRLTGKRVGRLSANVMIAGAVLGAVLAPALYMQLRFGGVLWDVDVLLRVGGIDALACTVGFVVSAWGIYQRRI